MIIERDRGVHSRPRSEEIVTLFVICRRETRPMSEYLRRTFVIPVRLKQSPALEAKSINFICLNAVPRHNSRFHPR